MQDLYFDIDWCWNGLESFRVVEDVLRRSLNEASSKSDRAERVEPAKRKSRMIGKKVVSRENGFNWKIKKFLNAVAVVVLAAAKDQTERRWLDEEKNI